MKIETYACHLKQQMYYLRKGSFSDSISFTITLFQKGFLQRNPPLCFYCFLGCFTVIYATIHQSAASYTLGCFGVHILPSFILLCITLQEPQLLFQLLTYLSKFCPFIWYDSVSHLPFSWMKKSIIKSLNTSYFFFFFFFRDSHDFPLVFRIADFKQMIFKCCTCHIASLDTAEKKKHTTRMRNSCNHFSSCNPYPQYCVWEKKNQSYIYWYREY